MGFAELLTAAIGLSADAFTAAVCKGIGMKRYNIRYALVIAAFFGGFQAAMPIAGWLLGVALQGYIASLDHWIAFGLLSFIGAKMITDSLHEETAITISSTPDYAELLGLAIATSIDALALGITLAFLNVNIFAASLLIGSVTFLASFFGVFAGLRFGARFGSRPAIIGGIVLIFLGVKILLSHTIFFNI